MASYDAVLFDLDGTLCTHDQDEETIYFGAFETAGIEAFGEPGDLWSALAGAPDPNDPKGYLVNGFERVADKYGFESVDTAALATGFMETVDHTAVSFRSGAVAALEAAAVVGHVGLITNGPEHRQSIKIGALGLEDAFDVVVFAGDMPRRKPHADPFDHALDALSVRAETSLYVGNSLEFDVEGAQNAGLSAAWCPEEPAHIDSMDGYAPEFVFESLHELAAALHPSD
ncbi:HAD family hydrolase [Haloferax namakaokahaiae]|uniref:HAD family hydrolase n=1 Tax=Haloferax namakaokahaiae TaxID=1748331 RepID=A0ABD5ZEN2_9EURY